jgi:putative hydrolase of the HAD superfamily
MDKKNLVVVFDLGGTLMEFRGMPPVWIDYYKTGFENVNKALELNLTEEKINQSVEIMKSYNPRVNYREIEIAPTEIFINAISEWTVNIDVNNVINCFFEGVNSNAIIYDYAFDMINDFKSNGYKVACLTDLPNGMPDDVFKKPIQNLIDEFDLYVSSQSCGYRKPNKFGLEHIAKHFDVDVKDLLFIGDEEKDKQVANNAGCEFKFIGYLL